MHMSEQKKTRRQMLEEFVAKKPDDAFSRYGLAMECMNGGDTGAADEHFRELLRRNADYVPAYLMYAQMLSREARAPVRIILDREEQLRHGLTEAPAGEMRGAYYKERRADADARTEAQRGFGMLDRDVGLARPQPECAADKPAAREIRVECQRTIDQRHHGADVLAEIGQRLGGVREDAWVVASPLQGSPCEIGALQSVPLPVFAPVVDEQPITAIRCPGECGP